MHHVLPILISVLGPLIASLSAPSARQSGCPWRPEWSGSEKALDAVIRVLKPNKALTRNQVPSGVPFQLDNLCISHVQ
jgi:hypothetical protein